MTDSIRVTVEELRLRNFRAFDNARLRLSDLTYLVGRNGAGKSSLLDAIALMQEAVSDSLENALDRRGGVRNVGRMWRGIGTLIAPPGFGLALVLSLHVPGREAVRLVYGFEVFEAASADERYKVSERLVGGKPVSVFERVGMYFNSPGSKLDPWPPEENLIFPLIARADSIWSEILAAIRGMCAYEISPAHMAEAREIGDKTSLVRNGGNAGDVLKRLPDGIQHWIWERLALITPGIVDAVAETVYGRRILRFRQEQGEAVLELDARNISQGTLRAFGVLLALQQFSSPSLVVIDEIENSLHPSALGVLLDAALASSRRMPVVLTTHSPEVLSHASAQPERVRLIEWREGVSRIFGLSAETRAAVDEIDTVGWLLRSNALWPDPTPETCGDDLFALERPAP